MRAFPCVAFKREGRSITPDLGAEIAQLANDYADVAVRVDQLTDKLHDQDAAAHDVASAVSDFARSLMRDFGSPEDAAKRRLERILEIILQARVIGPLQSALSRRWRPWPRSRTPSRR